MGESTKKRTSIGGQALMEGVMMRGPKKTAMAVRLHSGKIVLEEWENDMTKKPAVYRIPFVRGIFNFIDSMVVGYKTLMRSAELSESTDEEAIRLIEEAKEERLRKAELDSEKTTSKKMLEVVVYIALIAIVMLAVFLTVGYMKKNGMWEGTTKKIGVFVAAFAMVCAFYGAGALNNLLFGCKDKDAKDESKGDSAKSEELDEADKVNNENNQADEADKEAKKDEDDDESLSSFVMGIIMVISSVASMVLAIGLFIWLPTFLYNILKDHFEVLNDRFLQSVFEGVLKIIIFLLYMWVITFMKEIKRTFMYHGAEHKTIFCFEHGLELTNANVKKQCRFHPRCGTSFIVLMLIISIAVAMVLPYSIPSYARAALKIACLPVTMGIGYEAIKLAGRKDNLFVRIISAPGLWVQRISTKEPEEDYMIECAIMAFNAVVPEDEKLALLDE